MSRFKRLAQTSIGAKSVVAVTGLGLFLFVIAHLLGNMTLWGGRDSLNNYAQSLQNLGPLLWIMRGGLLAIFVVHIATTAQLTLANREARPVAYAKEATVAASWASRHMLLSGLLVLAFVIYHLLHFTFDVIPTGAKLELEGGGKDVYAMVVAGFSNPLVAISYMVANVILGVHLVHGSKSLFQTLGLDQTALKPVINMVMPALAIFVAGGNIALPLTVLFGWVG